jgi:hypothetical protein
LPYNAYISNKPHFLPKFSKEAIELTLNAAPVSNPKQAKATARLGNSAQCRRSEVAR